MMKVFAQEELEKQKKKYKAKAGKVLELKECKITDVFNQN